MYLKCIIFISCLAFSIRAQFWKSTLSEHQRWELEMMALRESGICYRIEKAQTYDPDINYRTISYCCEGYVNRGTRQNLKCEPVCALDCSNGICLGPNHCECAPGYLWENERCKEDN